MMYPSTIANHAQSLASLSPSDEMLEVVEQLAPHRNRLTALEAARLQANVARRGALGVTLLHEVLDSPSGRVDLVALLEYCSEQELLIALQRLLADLLRVHEVRRGYARRRSLDPSRPVTPRRTRRERNRAERFRQAQR